jgi:hypothetical protein
VGFYGLEPSACFGSFNSLVEYFITVFFWCSWLSGPIISSTGTFDWACFKKYNFKDLCYPFDVLVDL